MFYVSALIQTVFISENQSFGYHGKKSGETGLRQRFNPVYLPVYTRFTQLTAEHPPSKPVSSDGNRRNRVQTGG